MANRNKLIAANIFAVMTTLLILTGSKAFGYEIGLSAEALLPNAMLLLLPQAGFFFAYLLANKEGLQTEATDKK